MSPSAKDHRLRAPEGKRTLTEKVLSMIGSVYPNFRKMIIHMEAGAPKA